MNDSALPTATLHSGPGLRIRRDVARPANDLLTGWSALPLPLVSDCMNRLNAMAAEIRPISENGPRLIGPACTARAFPGDNLFVHAALEIVKPGDVIVIDSSGGGTAVLGSSIAHKAKRLGVVGFVVDGLVRDTIELREIGLPIFCRGFTATGPLHRGPGEVNYPVQCGGVVVQPGDLILGDDEGVVVVPGESISDIRAKATLGFRIDKTYMEGIRSGVVDTSWVVRELAEIGCELEAPVTCDRS